MKNLKVYLATLLLSSSMIITSCSAELNEEDKVVSSVDEAFSTSLEVMEKASAIVKEELKREKEDQEAFEKVISNPEFIDTNEFKQINCVSITWDNIKKCFSVECSKDDSIYTVPLPDERLVGYMLKNCHVEYINFYDIENADVIQELSSLENVKEISIFDAKVSDLEILKKFTSLERIRLENCPNITDISFFEELPNITTVELLGTSATDLTPLSKCVNLKAANLRCNEFTNPEVLKDLEYLTSIKLEYNKISNVNQLSSLISKGLISKEVADSIVETTTNHKLLFSTGDSNGVALRVNYFEAQKEYYAEVLDESGAVIALIFTDEPYNFYDISEKIGEAKYLSIKNFPKEGYIHHLSNLDKYTTIDIKNCDFENFFITRGVEYLNIYNCPNLTGCLKVIYTSVFSNLKYLSIKNTGLDSIEGLNLCKDLEVIDLQYNNFSNYDFIKDARGLKTVTVTLDNDNIDTSIFENLLSKEVNVNVYEIIGSEDLGEEDSTYSKNRESTRLLERAK